MQSRTIEHDTCKKSIAGPAHRSQNRPWYLVLVCLMAMSALACTAQQAQPNPDKPILAPILTDPPDANAQMIMHEQAAKQQNFDAANIERRNQISEDSAKLLKLANDLKAEVEKTSKDTLSLSVIRKADEIERLAHDVKEKMKLTVGGGS